MTGTGRGGLPVKFDVRAATLARNALGCKIREEDKWA